MTRARARGDSVRDDVVRLAHRGLGTEDYWRAVSGALATAVPAEGSCLMTMDPATMLPTAEYVENGLDAESFNRLVEIELREPDFTKWVAMARSGTTAASLSDVTQGRLDRSTRHHEVRRPGGYADELRVVLTGTSGVYGALTVFRETDRPHFSSAELQLVTSLADVLSDGLRRSLLLEHASADGDDAGMLVLNPDDTVELANHAGTQWLDELGTGARTGTTLPLVVRAVARQSRSVAAGGDVRLARARVRTHRGRWTIVRASMLADGPAAPVAVLLEAARAAEMAPVLADMYGLTTTERRVTELVAQGFPTSQISRRLRISVYTVQDHLKSVFAKSGTGSRGDLVARLYFDQRAVSLTEPAPPQG